MTDATSTDVEPPAVGEVPADSARPPKASRTSTRLLRRYPVTGLVLLVVFAVVLYSIPTILGDPTRTRQWAEYLCYAMVAIGIDIAWGYGGMLTLGQGVFFGLGAYGMGMYLSLEQVPKGQLPQFMSLYSDYRELPLLWRPFEHLWFAVAASILVPMLLASLLGYLVFRRRIRGPYFAIVTQATALVFVLLLVGQLKLTAGTNGLTDFSTIFGRSKYAPGTNDFLYFLAATALLLVLLVGLIVVRSRYGRLLVAVRDSEDRVRFLGYDPALVKTVGFAISAGMAGIAGALAAPIIGIVAPNQFAVLPSILLVCLVAVGGRGTLWGAVLGAVVVSWGKTRLSEQWPSSWLYVQGALFIVVVGFLPGGLAGVIRSVRRRLPVGAPGGAVEETAPPVVASTPADVAEVAP
jgi:urea transport system permease protein